MEHRIAFIGFGTVGQGLAEILHKKRDYLKEKYDFDFKVVAVSDPIKGSICNPDGLDIHKLLELAKFNRISEYPEGEPGWNSLQTIEASTANIIVEATPTNLNTGEPGLTHIRAAIAAGKHIATTNKGPFVVAGKDLIASAKERGVILRYEGTVLSGTPSLSLTLEALQGIQISCIRGIVNGTTNFILTLMEQGKSYDEALKEAQRLGYAEANPTADVEGWDAAAKAIILANLVMDGDIYLRDIEREGITHLTLDDIMEAKSEGKRWKLIARIEKKRGRIRARVKPEKLPLDDPLAQIMGVTNALTISTDDLGDITIIGPGAGRRETGFALLADILAIHRVLAISKASELTPPEEEPSEGEEGSPEELTDETPEEGLNEYEDIL